MLKLTVLAAALTSAALAVAPAHADDLRIASPTNPAVRISVSGKSQTQLSAEIKAAATTVCTDHQNLDSACFNDAVQDASDQVNAITLARSVASSANVAVSHEGAAATAIPVALAGKSRAEVDAEVSAAARKVCSDDKGLDSACFSDAVDQANDQLDAIARANRTVASADVDVSREGPSTIRISLKGKSPAQIDAEISAAAHQVCHEATSGGMEYDSCVESATSDAKAQLLTTAQAASPKQFASN